LLRYTTTIHIPTGIYTISGELAFNEKDKKSTPVGKLEQMMARRLNSGGHRYAAAGVIPKNEVRKQLLT